MQKKFIPLIIGISVAAGIGIGSTLNFNDSGDRLFPSNSKKDKLNRLIDYIEYDYVDEINTDSIVDITVNNILSHLDPHSVYISKNEAESVSEDMKGQFVGIGIQFYIYKDTIAVIRTINNGPSAKAGIQSGDRILYANGEKIHGKIIQNKDITKKLKGTLGSKVKLKIFRKGKPKLIDFVVTRGEVPIKSVDAAYMINSKIGYLKINRFAERTFDEFQAGIKKLKKYGFKELILDLRGNSGGYLEIAEKIADEFLKEDKLILFTKNKKGEKKYTYATSKGELEHTQVYVLIDENSASASEIVAGALQDNDRGVIVGRRSFGKGLVQSEMTLGDGSAVRLTVARYYTPTGRSIQKSYAQGSEAYHNDYLDRYSRGELTDADKIQISDSLKFKTPKGKIVYGGGGIIPDIFVPVDEYLNSETLNFLNENGLFSNFVFEQLDKNRKLFNGITKKQFIENFRITDDILFDFEKYLNQKSTYELNLESDKSAISNYLKAHYADQLFGNGAFEEVINLSDLMIDKVKSLNN